MILPPEGALLLLAAHAAEEYAHIPFEAVNRDVSTDEWKDWNVRALAALERGVKITDAMPVSLTNASQTVWGTKYGNALFRFWHDAVHFTHQRFFQYVDEIQVAAYMLHDAEALIDKLGLDPLLEYRDAIMRTVEAETLGQTLYHMFQGDFPVNQIAFASDWLEGGLALVLKRAAEDAYV